MAADKKSQPLARQLFKLSFADGRLSSERVAGVLGYLEKLKPAHPLTVLNAYHRLVSVEVAKGQAVVEHAGAVSDAALANLSASLSKKYARPVLASAKANPALLAGLRVRVGDDVYESSVAGQLSTLAASV